MRSKLITARIDATDHERIKLLGTTSSVVRAAVRAYVRKHTQIVRRIPRAEIEYLSQFAPRGKKK